MERSNDKTGQQYNRNEGYENQTYNKKYKKKKEITNLKHLIERVKKEINNLMLNYFNVTDNVFKLINQIFF